MNKLMLIAGLLTAATAMPAFANEHHMEEKARFCLKQMDADESGKVSKKEASDFSAQMFEKADTNNDDMLTVVEIQAQKEQDKAAWKEHKRDSSK